MSINPESQNTWKVESDQQQFGILDWFGPGKQDGKKNKATAEAAALRKKNQNEEAAHDVRDELLEERAEAMDRIRRFITAEIKRLKKGKNFNPLRSEINHATQEGHMTHIINSAFIVGGRLSALVEVPHEGFGFPDGSPFSGTDRHITVTVPPITFDEINALAEMQQLDAQVDRKVARNYKTQFVERGLTEADEKFLAGLKDDYQEGQQIIAFDIVASCAHCDGDDKKTA